MYNNTEGYKDVYIPVSERRVQWESNEDKAYLQQRTKLQGEIDELWKLMSYSKISNNRMKQKFHIKIGLNVKNTESKTCGALQFKFWKPRRLQPIRHDDSRAYGQFQIKVWDLGR